MTNEEIKDAIQQHEDYDSFKELVQYGEKEPEQFGEFKVTSIQAERENSDYNCVFQVEFNGESRLFAVYGAYDSWNGTDMSWSHWTQVKPVDRIVTFYEQV